MINTAIPPTISTMAADSKRPELHRTQKINIITYVYIAFYRTDRILDLSKLKAFADDKVKLIQMEKIVLDKIKNIVGKEENAGYQHFP